MDPKEIETMIERGVAGAGHPMQRPYPRFL
jgi:hypothetical protein